jgi:hypothetical protein
MADGEGRFPEGASTATRELALELTGLHILDKEKRARAELNIAAGIIRRGVMEAGTFRAAIFSLARAGAITSKTRKKNKIVSTEWKDVRRIMSFLLCSGDGLSRRVNCANVSRFPFHFDERFVKPRSRPHILFPHAIPWRSHDPFGSRFITNGCNQRQG